MAFCLLLERPVLARSPLSPRRSAWPPLPGHRLRKRPDLSPPCRARRAGHRLRLLRKIRSTNYHSRITYQVLDATDEQALLSLGQSSFDAALSNMALFDMADIETLFRILPKLLKPGGILVFSLMHPAFNNSSSVHVMQEADDGEIKTVYSVKISRYMTPYHAKGLALRGQPKAQMYFERPLRCYLNLGFQNGFVLDSFEERAFPPDHPQTSPLGWGGKFSELSPVLVARLRKISK